MSRKPAPFRVHKCHVGWTLHRTADRPALVGTFATQAAAIDHAYRNWPWWP
jgi:hypothetical protein